MLTQEMVDELNALFKFELGLTYENSSSINNWTCPIGKTVIGEYCVIPLISKKMVKSEGYMMQNCCREYIPLCINDEYHLFSIQSLSGNRIATLGVKQEYDRWRLDDCLGPQNTPIMEGNADYLNEDGGYDSEFVLTDIYFVAHEVVRLMNRK